MISSCITNINYNTQLRTMASKMTCKNSPKDFYTGKEKSPLGKGFCADAEKVGVKMTGSDDKEWVVGLNKGKKLWIRAPEEKVKEPEPEPSDKEDSDASDDSDNDDSDKEETPPPKPKAKVEPKPKAPPKKKAAPKEDTEESSSEEKPKPKAKKESKSALDKVLEAHNIDGDAAKNIKALFAKKVKKAKDDEDKPKRAPSTYNKYISVKLTELRKEKPDLPAKEYMQLAGALWKEMDADQKAAFA